MSITFSCTSCGTTFKVADQYAGKKTNCRKCKALLTIPSEAYDESLDPPELGFADEDPTPPPSSPMARPLQTPMYESPGSLERDDPPPLIAALPKVERRADVTAFDYAPSRHAGGKPARRPSLAGDDRITPLLVLLVLGAMAFVIIRSYATWPPEQTLAQLERYQVPREVIDQLGIPHMLVLIPPVVGFVSIFVLLAPALLVAWTIATKLTNGTLPPDAYKRCVGLATLPFVYGLILNMTPLAGDRMALVVGMIAIIPLAWLILNRLHGARGAEGAIAMGVGTVTMGLAMLAMGGVVFMVGGQSKQAYSQKLTRAVQAHVDRRNEEAQNKMQAEQRSRLEQAAQQRQRESDELDASISRLNRTLAAERAARGLPPTSVQPRPFAPGAGPLSTPEPSPAPRAPINPEVRRLAREVAALQKGVDATLKTREAAAQELAALRAAIQAEREKTPDHADWSGIDSTMGTIDAAVGRLPHEKPDDSIYAAIELPEEWTSDAPADKREFSIGPINFARPLMMGVVAAPVPNQPDALVLSRSDKETLRIEVVPVVDSRQMRPWVRTRDTPPVDGIFSVEAGRQLAVSTGRFVGQDNALTFVRIIDRGIEGSDDNATLTHRSTYVARLPEHWLVFRLKTWGAHHAVTPIFAPLRTARLRQSGEPVTDPFSVRVMLEEYDPRSEELTQALVARKAETEAELVKTLDADPSDNTYSKFGALLPLVASEKSTKHLWKLAEARFTDHYGKARGALSEVDPKNVDELRFALMDLSGDQQASRNGLEKLLEMPLDARRKAEVSKALLMAIQSGSFNQWNKGELLERVLARWGNEHVFAALMQNLADERGNDALRASAIGALSRTGQNRYAPVVARWILKESTAVTEALKRFGAAGETEAMKLLAARENEARRHAAGVLHEIGTARSLAALARAAKDARDPMAAAVAQESYEAVKARADAAKAKPTTQPGL